MKPRLLEYSTLRIQQVTQVSFVPHGLEFEYMWRQAWSVVPLAFLGICEVPVCPKDKARQRNYEKHHHLLNAPNASCPVASKHKYVRYAA